VPHFIRVPLAVFVASMFFGTCLWQAASSLRERWREADSKGAFFNYYLRLTGIGFAIVIAFGMLIVLVGWLIQRS
jgi:hypothetical protein